MTVVLGLDIGTTSTIGILVGLPDRILATATRPVTLSSPTPDGPRRTRPNGGPMCAPS